MTNTQQTISAETIVDRIWTSMNRLRGAASLEDMAIHILTALYAYHKGYTPYENRANDNDTLYNDLINTVSASGIDSRTLQYLSEDLHVVSRSDFNKIYREILICFFDRLSSYGGRINGDFYTPQEINRLMAYILNKNNCNSIYDPFCGTASIVYELTKNSPKALFEGQELNHRTSLFARVCLEATFGSDNSIKVCDSTRFWSNNQYDAVATCPPLSLRLTAEQQRAMANLVPNLFCSSIEDLVFSAPFSINQAKLSIVLTTVGFCYRGSRGTLDYDSRRYLIEQNLLDTVIALPSNILYGTSIPSVLLICKKYRKPNDPITFVHAEEYYTGDNRKRNLDVDRLINMIETSREDCIEVQHSEVVKYGYNLNPSLYVKKEFDLKEGQQIVCLGDLITFNEGERITDNSADNPVSLKNLSGDFIEILLNNSKVSGRSDVRQNIRYRHFAVSDKKYLLVHTSSLENKYGLFTDSNSFSCPVDIKAYEINENIVTPEYLAYILTQNAAISKSRMALSSYLSFQIVIDSIENQKELVSKLIQQYNAKVEAEREADAKRLGIQQNISDLEHMLGLTQNRIGKIIKRLENCTPEMGSYLQVVQQLKDNVGYMNRIIRYANANIEQDSIYKRSDDLIAYIASYVDGWINYGRNCFELSVVNDLEENPSISFDRNMLTVMFDSILNNAVRHGFHKIKTEGNRVQIRLSLVERESKPFVLISVANNGLAMADGFTIDDFISRGRFSASTGRSGLGGFHTYQIVKGHGGFLYLDNNKQWSVIVEVLLPLDSSSINNIPEYDHECI